MDKQFIRTAWLIGEGGVLSLKEKRVAVFGVGGVGGYAVEALARCGVGAIDLIDSDKVSISNINRQIHATHSTVGSLKVEAAKERILDINPSARVEIYPIFYSEETADTIDLSRYDFAVDAIDTVSSKLLLIERAKAAGVPIISSMGTGNKLDPTRLEVTDISKTSVCPLARVMRYELKKRGIHHLTVVYSKEEPIRPQYDESPDSEEGSSRKRAPGSIAFVPSVAGLIIAGEVVRALSGRKE
ncbi:MAG: tRNA threonylcarbamoyladenosine dehydratase [Clostridia bacterium]|nr:tRNA threonylcarbamoyladenosine dehydratase [Clostridia bacterium]